MDPILLPPPIAVWSSFSDSIWDGTLLHHTLITLQEMFFGLLAGVGIGLAIGYAIAKAPSAGIYTVADYRRLSVGRRLLPTRPF